MNRAKQCPQGVISREALISYEVLMASTYGITLFESVVGMGKTKNFRNMSATHTMRARREGYIPSRLTSTPDRPVVSSGRYDSATGVKYAPSKRYPTFKPEPKMYVSSDDVSRLSTKGYPGGVSKDERKLIVSYWSSWHWIAIFEPFHPWKVLGLHSSQVPFWEVKSTFKSSITQLNPQKRAMVSIAYHMITSSGERYRRVYGTDEYVVGRRDHFLLAACGHADELARMINYRQHIVEDKDEYGRTLLYTASKSGFYDVCKLLLQKGASVDEPQRDGSTPLHGAAYFSHEMVVGLLLQHGARTDIKNNWGHTALDESATRKIQDLVQSASFDCISSLAAELKRKQLLLSVGVIEYKGSVIAKEFVRNASILDTRTRAEWNNIHRNWEVAWHGTKYRHLQSILEKGLLPAGSSGIKPAEGHFSLGEVHFGVRNWAAAIFVSPSILYASHAAYSERVFSESQKWCVLIKAYCRPGSMTAYDPTVLRYDRKDDEPEKPEYRVPVQEEDKNVILRVESARNVVVRSAMFVRVSFLEDRDLNFEEAIRLLH